nr:MAG TPA: hypothetical protein [Caudoviricetes sp.]
METQKRHRVAEKKKPRHLCQGHELCSYIISQVVL